MVVASRQLVLFLSMEKLLFAIVILALVKPTEVLSAKQKLTILATE